VTIFNRVLIIVLSLALLIAAGAVLLTALGVLQPVQVAPLGRWFVERLIPFTELETTLWNWTVVICLALMVVAVLLLILELGARSREGRRITLKNDSSGRVTVALDGLRELTEREAVQVTGVNRARARVAEDTNGLRIACNVSVDPAISVPDMTQELRERIKAAIEHHVGLPVKQVSVDANVAPLVVARSRRHHARVE
jgi:hypothetical protein